MPFPTAINRPSFDRRDGDLPRVGRHEPVAVHPPAESGRAEVPVVGRLGRNGVALREIRNLRGAVGSDSQRHDESHCRADDANERKAKHGHGGNAVRVQATGGDQSGFIIASIDSAKAFPMSANVFAHPR